MKKGLIAVGFLLSLSGCDACVVVDDSVVYDHLVDSSYLKVLQRMPTGEELAAGNAHFQRCKDKCVARLNNTLVRSDEYRERFGE